MSRLTGRLRIFSLALPRLPLKRLRAAPATVGRILVSHRLRLGDALLLVPFLKKLRQTYPAAHIAMTCPPELVVLFAGNPFGVTVLPYNPRDSAGVAAITGSGPYDLAFVLGDNRYAWLALAAGSRWIVAHEADTPLWMRWPVDDHRLYPDRPAAWGELIQELLDGPPVAPYRPADWTAPAAAPFPLPGAPASYVVLHPGASSAVKQWPADRWSRLADWLGEQGLTAVWSGGAAEVALVQESDPEGRFTSFAGRLDLAQLWHLLANARALVCPDTGVAHLGRMVGVPTLTLFGPGSVAVHGAGEFWKAVPYAAVTVDDMPCRNQPRLFSSGVAWARRCDRNLDTCVNRSGAGASCMTDISEAMVRQRLGSLLEQTA